MEEEEGEGRRRLGKNVQKEVELRHP